MRNLTGLYKHQRDHTRGRSRGRSARVRPAKPHEKYPHITKAALEISYDNGGINRDRSEQKMLRELDEFLSEHETFYSMGAINAFLGSLTKEQLETACCGEVTDAERILKPGPTMTGALLTDIFENVC